MKKQPEYTDIPNSTIADYRANLAAKILLERPIIGGLDTIPGLDSRPLALAVSSENSICGFLYDNVDKTAAVITHFRVVINMRNKGIGQRLFRAFVAEAKSLGSQELWSDAVSIMALRLRAKVLGESSLKFFDSSNADKGFLPINLDQAIAINERIDRLDITDPDRRKPQDHIGVYVDLTTIDTTDWERPVEVLRT